MHTALAPLSAQNYTLSDQKRRIRRIHERGASDPASAQLEYQFKSDILERHGAALEGRVRAGICLGPDAAAPGTGHLGHQVKREGAGLHR